MSVSGQTTLHVEGHGAITVDLGDVLLEACEANDIPMESECGGFAGCNSCRIEVTEGTEGLSEVDPVELPFLDEESQRLGCQVTVKGPFSFRLCPGMV